jgi:hypothetical protein
MNKRSLINVMAAACVVAGCSDSGAKPLHSKEEQERKFVEETQGERKVLEDLEKKYGKDHPQVKQMRLELGIEGGADGPGGSPGTGS